MPVSSTKKLPLMEEEASPDDIREGEEDPKMPSPQSKTNRKRSAKGVKETKAPMDGEACSCGKRKGACKMPCGKAVKDGACTKKMDAALSPYEYLGACDLGIQDRSRSYIRARLDAQERLDLKCGKGAVSQGEKCSKGAASKAQGPNAAVQLGQVAKGLGRGVLETGKWVSGYNIGKTIASNVTQGKNEKGSGGAKASSIIGSALLLNPIAGIGAARRVGAFGSTDLQQHAQNEKKEKTWRKSVGYKDGMYAKGFKVDYSRLEA